MSSIPPYMNPQKVKYELEKYGKITRMHILEEDASEYKNRLKLRGNKHKKYKEGWIEMEDKEIAKRMCQALNGEKIGGKKRSFYHDDLWMLKYLKGFKWTNLMEKISKFFLNVEYEKNIKKQKLLLQINHKKRIDKIYLKNYETSRKQEFAMKRKGIVKIESQQ